ncbi:GNAT family N-acetyltransferase [Intestinibacter sp.]|uniref:GNAT family N-acetyltransferase n=1 Tax=Intestinibacter sp. TaxID=1965304 RepID=UPI003F186E54
MNTQKIDIRKLSNLEIEGALDLVWQVFLKFEAPEYPQEGVDEFKNFISDKNEIAKLVFYGAFIENKIVGVLAMREKHISLFFVDEKYHKNGIGKKLFLHTLEEYKGADITVNSSPYARCIYGKLGFVETSEEQITNGIRYIPMIYKSNRK